MLNVMPVNIFFDGLFVCSSSYGKSELLADAYNLELGNHISLFDMVYICKTTGKSSTIAALRDFISAPKFFEKGSCFGFDAKYYSSTNDCFANLHPIIHYLIIGDNNNARTHPEIWSDWLRSRYPSDSRTTLEIFVAGQGLIAPNPFFDPIWYLDTHIDVFRAGMHPFKHYLSSGRREGRSTHKLTDWAWYTKHSGVKAPGISDFLERRWVDALFPHPAAQAHWVYLSETQLIHLFTANLAPSTTIKEPIECPSHYKLVDDFVDLARSSISASFSINKLLSVESDLVSDYRRNSILENILVSIVIPTKNRLETLKLTVNSALEQLHKNVEVLVIDDGSSDSTFEWLATHPDIRVKRHQSFGRGVSAARNIGLSNAQGAYVAFLDSDNVMPPNFIACMTAYCEGHDSKFVYGALRLYNNSGIVRYRFKEYGREDLWRTNYIDMNVVFHSREKFHTVKFDEDLKRCVDWDYVLKLTKLERPTGVPVIGCDYFHDGSAQDRITTNGPVWDCFRVSQRHRPPAARASEKLGSVTIYPVRNETFDLCYRELRLSLPRIAGGSKLQVVFGSDVARWQASALNALLVSAGHPSPIVSQMPLDSFALFDFGLALCKLACDRWNFVDPALGIPLLDCLFGRGSEGCEVHVRSSSAGEYDAIIFQSSSDKWNVTVIDDEVVSTNRLPLLANILNVPYEDARDFDFRFTTKLSIACFIYHLATLKILKLIKHNKERKIVDTELCLIGVDILNSSGLGDYTPTVSYTSTNVVGVGNAITNGTLRTILSYSRVPKGNAMAIFTPAPHEGSGWGDEHYAKSLSVAFETLGINADVVFRDHWKEAGSAYRHILHIRGIAKIVPIPSASNSLWVISHPEKVTDEEYDACDDIFVASSTFARGLSQRLGRPVHFLPQCTSFTPHQIGDLSETAPALRDYASFLGDSKNVLRHPINELITTWDRLFLLGPNWRVGANMGVRFRSGYVANFLLPKLYYSFGAVLNQHWTDMAKSGFVSNRLYDVAASGGQFITDDCAEIPPELLSFGLVWIGGDFEDYFQKLPWESPLQRIEKANQFVLGNSFAARARDIENIIF